MAGRAKDPESLLATIQECAIDRHRKSLCEFAAGLASLEKLLGNISVFAIGRRATVPARIGRAEVSSPKKSVGS